MLAFLILSVFINVLMLRGYWLIWHYCLYSQWTSAYVFKYNVEVQDVTKYFLTWPWYSIAARPWKWGLRDFMVYPELYDDVIKAVPSLYATKS